MTNYTARALSTSKLQNVVTQTAHGFVVGVCVINAALIGPPNYITARASSVSLSFCTMMVSFVIDADNFVVTQTGYITNITNQTFIAGSSYYLSPTTGGQVTVIPPTDGQVYLPCFKADTTTSGYFFGGSGILINPPIEFATVVSSSTTVALLNDTRYVMTNSSLADLTLPVAATVGQQIIIDNNGTGNLTVTQRAGQQIQLGSLITIAGATGGISSLVQGDSITLTCVVANLTWFAEANIGGRWEVITV